MNPTSPFKRIAVLLVSPFQEDHQDLEEILRHSNWQRLEAQTHASAVAYLEANPTPVVICEADLPDGTWKDLYAHLAATVRPPVFVVTSRLADERLWSEVLNLGAFNVLAKPLHASEVFHVVSFAWQQWTNLREQPARYAQNAA